MPVLYDIGLGLYHAGIRVAALFSPKAKAWVEGRKGIMARLEAKRAQLHGCLWMHCASVGEFEQGRPVLEALKRERPEFPVLITFYSPSGYEARKEFPLATHVDYLPADGGTRAQAVVDLVRPKAVLWVKYEFWYHWLHALKERGLPVFLISAIFRPDQSFFRWYGSAYRRMLHCYTHLFVQDQASRDLLTGIGVRNVTIGGDTRFDRVAAIVAADEVLPEADRFRRARDFPILVCGSTWPADDQLIHQALMRSGTIPRCIVAPHEISEKGLAALRSRYPGNPQAWDDPTNLENSGTLIVDRVGLLARLYKYADVAYVGGGFGDGIHSLLEAAAWGKPVIFGPNHHKFAEAKGLIDAGAGFEVRDADELRAVLDRLFNDPNALKAASEAAQRYVQQRLGSTEHIVRAIAPEIAH